MTTINRFNRCRTLGALLGAAVVVGLIDLVVRIIGVPCISRSRNAKRFGLKKHPSDDDRAIESRPIDVSKLGQPPPLNRQQAKRGHVTHGAEPYSIARSTRSLSLSQSGYTAHESEPR